MRKTGLVEKVCVKENEIEVHYSEKNGAFQPIRGSFSLPTDQLGSRAFNILAELAMKTDRISGTEHEIVVITEDRNNALDQVSIDGLHVYSRPHTGNTRPHQGHGRTHKSCVPS